MQHRPRNVYHLSAVAGRFTRLGMICGVNTRMEAGRRPRGEKDGERGGWKRALWRPSSHDSLHDPVCRACCQARNACSRLRICSRKLAYRSFFVKLFPRFLLRFSDINILEIIYYRDKRRLKPKEQFSSKFFHLFQNRISLKSKNSCIFLISESSLSVYIYSKGLILELIGKMIVMNWNVFEFNRGLDEEEEEVVSSSTLNILSGQLVLISFRFND